MGSVTVSEVIDRPPAEVFRFVATDHVQNHPRWDPNMSLEQVTPGPLAVGTVIRRSYTRGGQRVEGEMEVTDYEPDRTMGAVIRDGPTEIGSRMTVEPQGEHGTLLTFFVDADVPEELIQGSLARIKELVEAES